MPLCLREKADYEDFVASMDDTGNRIKKADRIIGEVESYVKTRWFD